MKLSKTVEYAVMAVIQLAAAPPGVPIPCSRLASRGDMPERFLLQILRALTVHGILRSVRGIAGGYLLNCDPADITLLAVIEVIDGPIMQSPQLDNTATESVRRMWAVLEQLSHSMKRQLESISIADLKGPTAHHEAMHGIYKQASRWQGASNSESAQTHELN